MEFTIEPKIQKAYDEIIKTQGYQTTFQQQLAYTGDAGQQAKIRAAMTQNDRYIAEQSQLISQLKPNLDEFKNIRTKQVAEVLENNRKGFTDKELKNEYIFNELRDKLSKNWKQANTEILPGIKNLDLISSDETLLGLIRDGLKFRDRPTTKQAGASAAVLTGRKTPIPNTKSNESDINALREKAKAGDKKAGDNLLMMQLAKLRANRNGR